MNVYAIAMQKRSEFRFTKLNTLRGISDEAGGVQASLGWVFPHAATALSAATAAAAGPALMASKGALLLELRSPPAHLLSLIGAAHLPSQVTAQTRRHWCCCRRVNLCGQHACIPLPFVRCA